ncbi:uncharacterized protein N7469_004903 [Penicillium citrinum]|uniref:Kinesin light chain n=1 Tax=Penicillium citrinum TaxID=5077 RepID=A0A9W9TR00_PENCI|nr:uncharacterized protein N7469_004903 [Penicillium citrinum]KAJ5235735.1 hypothetical protein N7469_004903 [Penicillium citrinum]
MRRASLGSSFSHQGQWEKAQELLVKAIEAGKRELGEEKCNILTMMENLTYAHRKQGQWIKAEQLGIQVMKMCERRFGEDHRDNIIDDVKPSILIHVPKRMEKSRDVASPAYWHQGSWQEAESLFVRVIKGRKLRLGDNHPVTILSTESLGKVYLRLRQLEEAEPLVEQVIQARKAGLGEGHPKTLGSQADLAFIWKFSGQNTDAVRLMCHVLKMREQVKGANHPDTQVYHRDLAGLGSRRSGYGCIDVGENRTNKPQGFRRSAIQLLPRSLAMLLEC